MPATLELAYPPFPGLDGTDEDAHGRSIDPDPQLHPPTLMSPPLDPPTCLEPTPHTSPTQTVPPTPSPSTIVSPLNNIPPDISTHRALLFALDTPVQLTPTVWSRFWPFIDNVWCLHQRPIPNPSTGISKVYGGCRLNRKTNFPPPVIHENSRPRQRREGGTCKAKFRLTVYPDGRRVVERTGEQHSHTLEHIDGIKRNTGVRALVLDDFFKSWEAGGILAFLRDTSTSSPSRDILRDAGGLYLSRQEVQNILNGALKKAYPNQDVSTIKKQMDKYKNYTTCNFKGCSAQAFRDIKSLMEHRKSVHGLRSHDHSDKVYACPDKACWRRKRSKGFATVLGLEEHVKEKHAERAGELLAQGTGMGMGVGLGGAGCGSAGESNSQMDGGADGTVQDGEDTLLDGMFTHDPHTDMDDSNGTPLGLNLNTHLQSNSLTNLISNLPTLGHYLQDPSPITPDSSTEDVEQSHQHEPHHQEHAEMEPENQNIDMDMHQEMEMEEEQTPPLSHVEKENLKLRIQRLKIEREKLEREENLCMTSHRYQNLVHLTDRRYRPRPWTIRDTPSPSYLSTPLPLSILLLNRLLIPLLRIQFLLRLRLIATRCTSHTLRILILDLLRRGGGCRCR
ncbi:hypothetical protein P154DRAFT_157798 [Amniculicola lignicola CBS 123094]|uniref:C2H2-type domain-containing protein n=1 Tax=Amniculicola lignicola CBS 123094 TaxID=1392246 RepID=A0A6A5VTC5_9PLEO|nr:hypothetical protein P154DRAFT_157798 [Amniculicola lignicola CBS 123094]